MDNFDMDVDFLPCEDSVEKFLISKLKLMEAKKLELTQQLDRRQTILKETIRKSASLPSKQLVKVDNVWKKIVYNKYVIGINISGSRNTSDLDIILSWKEKSPLNYCYDTSKRFDEICSKELQTIIVITPLPSFTHLTSVCIDGILAYNENSIQLDVTIPTITLEASDVTNDVFLVKKESILVGEEESLLALMAASEETNVFLYFEQSNDHRIVDGVLEMDCCFRRIQVKNGYIFYAGEASDYFDGAILQSIKGDHHLNYLNIYSRNIDQMLAILHHLYKNFSNIVILPMCLEQQFRNHLSLYSDTEINCKKEALKQSLQDEINLVEEFFERYRIHCDNSDDMHTTDKQILDSYKKFRFALNEQEMKSDLLYSALKNCSVTCDDFNLDSTSDISL